MASPNGPSIPRPGGMRASALIRRAPARGAGRVKPMPSRPSKPPN